MTQQYGQTAINIQQAIPVSFATPDAAPVLVDLYTLTEDGQSVTIFLEGGGAAVATPNVDNAVFDGYVTFTRDGGVVSVGLFALFAANNGAPILAGFVATGNICQFSITGPGFPYEYRAMMSIAKF